MRPHTNMAARIILIADYPQQKAQSLTAPDNGIDIYRGKGISRGNAAYQVVKAYQFAALTHPEMQTPKAKAAG